MPRAIDRDAREREITRVAMDILETAGPAALTLRAIATRLGGSNTLVTHFYPNRVELLNGILSRVLEDLEQELAALEVDADPAKRMWTLLRWMLPLDDDSLKAERGRVFLLSGRASELPVQEFVDSLEGRMINLLETRLRPLVSKKDVVPTALLLRAVTNGIVLSAVEHPDKWPPREQVKALERVLRGVGLAEVADAARSAPRRTSRVG